MKIIAKNDDEYPDLLHKIKNKPQELYFEGDIDCCKLPCITVIGSRNMTEYGKQITQKIVKDLTLAGMCIVSGLAVGIDSVAHRTCVENGGKTIAVLGSGLNKVYPKENIGLYEEIIKSGGCVISEQEPDKEAEKIFFPARNRIVSGLSLGTLVIEATYRSGTSITANFAFEQGRKVFCVPNMIGNKNSSGTIKLMKKGAILVTQANEILYGLGLIDQLEDIEELTEKNRKSKINIIENDILMQLDELTKKIYMYIKENKIINLEIMGQDLKISVKDLNVSLTILELKGLIESKSGSSFTVKDELYV